MERDRAEALLKRLLVVEDHGGGHVGTLPEAVAEHGLDGVPDDKLAALAALAHEVHQAILRRVYGDVARGRRPGAGFDADLGELPVAPVSGGCARCGTATTFVTGRRPTADGVLCDDCWFGAVGAEIEANPIGRRPLGPVRGSDPA